MTSTILASSTGWNSNLPDVHPETGSAGERGIDAEVGHEGQQEEDHPEGEQEVAVSVEVA